MTNQQDTEEPAMTTVYQKFDGTGKTHYGQSCGRFGVTISCTGRTMSTLIATTDKAATCKACGANS